MPTTPKNNLDWRRLYFGHVSPQEVQEAIADDEWQQLRESIKGQPLEVKYSLLLNYYQRKLRLVQLYTVDKEKEVRKLQVRLTNYVTALSRGGLILPEEYK